MKDIHYYFILNVGAADGGEVSHAVFQGKIEYKPGANVSIIIHPRNRSSDVYCLH